MLVAGVSVRNPATCNLLKERSILTVEDSGLPRSKLLMDPLIASSGFGIAPLDMKSMLNGMLKWEHDYKTITHSDYNVMLDWLDALYGTVIHVTQWSQERAMLELDLKKACGYPYNRLFGPTKGDAVRHLSFDDLLQHFQCYNQIFTATLKDEERALGKDSRLFTPANVVMIAVGNWLFGAQNEEIGRAHV